MLLSPVALALGLALPGAAGAATPSELWAPAPGSPDGRVYELVSPPEKDGTQAGAETARSLLGLASPDGERVVFGTSGAVGPGPTGLGPSYSIAQRASEGWQTRGALPAPIGNVEISAAPQGTFFPSPDLTQLDFGAEQPYVEGATQETPDLYSIGEDTSVEPRWLSRPQVEKFNPGGVSHATAAPAGGPTNAGAIVFAYAGVLLPGDAPRATVAEAEAELGEPVPWGLYEWTGSELTEAGVRPDGTLDQYGAVPAAVEEKGAEDNPDVYMNEVSVDGRRTYFVSPDPNTNHPANDPVELYVREGGRSRLVSKDELEGGAPSSGYGFRGEKTAGLTPVTQPARVSAPPFDWASASPSGEVAFFRSMNKLANSASGEPPSGRGPFTYEYNATTDKVTYVPGVDGPVLASTSDGSTFAYYHYHYPEGEEQEKEENAAQGESGVLYVSSHGRTVEVGEMEEPTLAEELPGAVVLPARLSRSGQVLVFQSNAPVPQALDDEGHAVDNTSGFMEIYRYEVEAGRLVCISCSVDGTPAVGPASLSNDDKSGATPEHSPTIGAVVPTRGMDVEGTEVFFDTPQALVPQDQNGVRDVYEWERGHVYLISSGRSSEPSFFIDNGEDGRDVFFATAANLVKADFDGGYDVYDAREGGGFVSSQAPTGCTSDCQAGPAAPPTFPEPSSASFSGAADQVSPPPPPKVKSAAEIRKEKLAKALKGCRKKRSQRLRRRCERQARARYTVRLSSRGMRR